MQWLQGAATPESRRLLRVLLLWLGEVSACSGATFLLRLMFRTYLLRDHSLALCRVTPVADSEPPSTPNDAYYEIMLLKIECSPSLESLPVPSSVLLARQLSMFALLL